MTTDTVVLPPMTTAAPSLPRPRSRLRQLGIDTGYVLVGFPLAIAAFVVVVTGLALGAGLLIVWVGVAVLGAHAARRPRAGHGRAGPAARRPPPAAAHAGLPPRGSGRLAGDPAAHAAARSADMAGRAARRRPVPRRDLLVRRHGDLLVDRPRRPLLRRLGLGAARRSTTRATRTCSSCSVSTQLPSRRRILLYAVRRTRRRRVPAVRHPRGRPAAGQPGPRPAHLPRRDPGRADPPQPRAATPRSPRRPSPCAGSSATSTTARSSGWSG